MDPETLEIIKNFKLQIKKIIESFKSEKINVKFTIIDEYVYVSIF